MSCDFLSSKTIYVQTVGGHVPWSVFKFRKDHYAVVKVKLCLNKMKTGVLHELSQKFRL